MTWPALRKGSTISGFEVGSSVLCLSGTDWAYRLDFSTAGQDSTSSYSHKFSLFLRQGLIAEIGRTCAV